MNVLINSGRTTPFLGTRKKLVQDMIKKGHQVVVTGYQSGFEQEIESMGAFFVEVPVDRAGLNPFKDIKLIFRYYKIIKEYDIDVVHSYTIKPNIYGSIASRLAGLREVYPTLNGIGYAFTGSGFKANLVRFIASILYWVAFKCSKEAFFHNYDDIEEMIQRRLILRKKCVRLDGSGVDLEYYQKQDFPKAISFVLASRLLDWSP